MIDFIFKNWQQKLSDFESSVKKDLAEIRKCKAEIQQMRQETEFERRKGRYIRDDERLILSAPEIIIGNVDDSGVHFDSAGSTVIVRGSHVGLQGIGQGGQVEMRSESIRQIAEDPGSDGLEHVVGSRSEVVSQARHIVLHSQADEGVFSDIPVYTKGGTGVRIHADEKIEIDSSVSAEHHKERLTKLLEELKKHQKELEEKSTRHKVSLGQMVTMMEKLISEKNRLGEKSDAVRACYGDIEEVTGQIEELSLSLSEEVCSYADILSLLSETNRQLKCVETQKGKIKDAEKFKKETTGASVAVTGELITLESKDGDGHLRENDNAGIIVTGCGVTVQTTHEDSSLMDDGYIQLTSKAVLVDTTDNKDAKYDDEGKLTSAQCPVEGFFNVVSKNIVFEAVDKEFKNNFCKDKELAADGKIKLLAKNVEVSTAHVQNVEIDKDGKVTKAEYPADGEVVINSKSITVGAVDSEFDANEPHQRKEKALAKDSWLKLRSERMVLNASTTEGKATGSVALNAKQVNIMSMDFGDNSQSLSDKGQIQATAEKIFLGESHDEKLRSRKVQGWAEKITLLGSEKVQAIQGDKKGNDKAFLLLEKNEAKLKGSKTELHGPTKIVGDLDAPKVSAGDLKVKSEFKSKNISDGITAGPPPKSTLTVDADVTEEERAEYEQYAD